MENIQCRVLLSIVNLFLFDEISRRHSEQQNITSTEETEHDLWWSDQGKKNIEGSSVRGEY